ncbi:helix-turn-helix domain-containing protein [Verminephrobacter eiseniae]|uniref:helix-turn-helix domain-containing protein n=1 Tax=Verminephrobacter eiseniae TaxID=364317 RepID=UPI002237C12D|nr:helix-turn-helix transcriptional regulator [Verminephrobacter eiseniae]MCW5234994.1 XRE family transcriptional regulator [Verminephrobacter eiseniae]
MVKLVSLDKPKVPELVAFGDAVRRRRKELGYSQEGFGDACGIDRSYMGGIERGEHNLALVNILKIVNALGIQPSDFFKDLDKLTKKGRSKLP